MTRPKARDGGSQGRLVVVGGGPVGLVVALLAVRAGMDVRICEPRPEPIDKACGEGIMPSGVAALADLGVHPEGVPIRGIRYLSGAPSRHSAQAAFDGDPGRGVRRTTLHAALWAAAESAGVDLIPATVTALTQDAGSVRLEVQTLEGTPARSGQVLRAEYVVAADGLHSPMRRRLGLDAPVQRNRRYGLRRHAAVSPWTDHVEVYWGPDGEAYLTPVARDLVGVALLSRGGEPFDQQLAGYPALVERLDGAQFVTSARGAGPFRQRSRARVAGRVLLAGDASGYVDALTGEGLSVGLAQAREAVDAIAADRPASYEGRWRQVTNPSILTAAALVAATRHDAVRRTLVPLAGAVPSIFERVVNVLR